MITDDAATPPATLLTRQLASLPRVEGLFEDVHDCLGVPAGADLDTADVRAFHLQMTDTMISLYLVSGGALTIYQRTREGQMLSITVPIERLSRVSAGGSPDQLSVTLEIDADQVVTDVQGESLAAVDDTKQTRGRQAARHVTRRAGYTLTAAGGDRDQLRAFHRAVLGVLHRG